MKLIELLEDRNKNKTIMIISLIGNNNRIIGIVNVIYSDLFFYDNYDIKTINQLNESLYYKLTLSNEKYYPDSVIFDLDNKRILILKPKYINSIAKDLEVEEDSDFIGQLTEINFKLNNNPELLQNIDNLQKKFHIININQFKSISVISI
jgi:hypothetical protein